MNTDNIVGIAGVAVTAGVALGAMKMTERMCNRSTRHRTTSQSRTKRRKR